MTVGTIDWLSRMEVRLYEGEKGFAVLCARDADNKGRIKTEIVRGKCKKKHPCVGYISRICTAFVE